MDWQASECRGEEIPAAWARTDGVARFWIRVARPNPASKPIPNTSADATECFSGCVHLTLACTCRQAPQPANFCAVKLRAATVELLGLRETHAVEDVEGAAATCISPRLDC